MSSSEGEDLDLEDFLEVRHIFQAHMAEGVAETVVNRNQWLWGYHKIGCSVVLS